MQKVDNANTVKTKGTRKKIVYSLDWNAQTYEDRLNCVEKLTLAGKLEGLSPTQLNEVSNYLLHSSDVDCRVELKQSNKKTYSYEDMVENGIADMAINNSRHKNVYKIHKPSIDKEKDKDIPGMQELWESMEQVKEIYDYLDDCLKGRRERDFDNPLEITYAKHYYYKNWYIDLCLNQYTLKDAYRPVIPLQYKETLDWRPNGDDVDFGISAGEYVYYEGNGTKMINLGDSLQIYRMLKGYRNVRSLHREDIENGWHLLYNLLDEAISECNFPAHIWDILEMKINGVSNTDVGNNIRDKYGISYNDNYISTLFTKSISKKIAKASLIIASRKLDNVPATVCPRCKQERWKDEFLSGSKRCRYCVRKIQKEKKEIKLWGLE